MISGEPGQAAGGTGDVRLPAEVYEALLPHMRSIGYVPKEVVNLVPKVNMDLPVREMGMLLGLQLKEAGLFRYGVDRGLVIFEEGRRVEMTAVKFCSWVEKHVVVVKSYKGKGDMMYENACSLGKDLAAKLLECDEFKREMPIIELIVKVRVPVRRADGRVELLKKGYDKEARVMCLDEVPFDDALEAAAGLEWLRELHSEFMFADLDAAAGLWGNRSFLVHMGAMLGLFCRLMLPPGTTRPLVLVTANEQGAGKDNLVLLQMAGTLGAAASTDLPMSSKGLNPEKFTALLETVAQTMQPALYLSDVPNSVFSNALNRFVTAAAHTGRKYGGNDEMFEVSNVTQVFMTGNQVAITRDILQRAVVVELFLPMDSQSRSFKREITPEWLARPEQRGMLLAAQWAMVRTWVEAGMPGGSTVQRRAPQWARLVGGVLEACGVAVDIFATPELPMGGDEESAEWMRLLTLIADDAEKVEGTVFEEEAEGRGYTIDTAGVVRIARENHLLSDLVGTGDDKPLKGGELKRLGRRMAKWRGRTDLRSSTGRRFEFGKRKQASNWVYPVTWLEDETGKTKG